MRRRPSRADVVLLGIAAAGLLLRVVYTLRLGQHVSLGITDAARFYSVGANALADGRGYVDVFRALDTGSMVPTAHHPPGWPALLAVFSWLGVESQLGHRLVGGVVGALVIILVGLLGRRLGGPAVGLIAAAIVAVHPTMIAADGSLMSETLAGALVLAVVLAGLRVLEQPTAIHAAALGVLIGGAALVRGEALLYAPLVVLPVAVSVARRSDAPGRALVRVAGIGALGLAAIVLPWTVRNLVRLDAFVLISTNENSVLAGANCEPTYYGPDLGFWSFDCASLDDTFETEVETAAAWRTAGLTYARDHADRLPTVMVARVLRTWGVYDPLPPVAEGRHEGVQTAGVLVWLAVLLPLSIVGGVALARRRPSIELVVVLAPAVAATIISLLGFGMLRFRHSIELVAIVLAAIALDLAWRRVRQRWSSG